MAWFDRSDWSGGLLHISVGAFLSVIIWITMLIEDLVPDDDMMLDFVWFVALLFSSICVCYFIHGLFRMTKRLWSRPRQ